MYLNLDLLYNVEIYLFPLFYYKDYYSYIVYSPITKKSTSGIFFRDYITLNFKWNTSYEPKEPQVFPFKKENYIVTEIEFIRYGSKDIRCDPFKISKKEIDFLKSNTRIKKI